MPEGGKEERKAPLRLQKTPQGGLRRVLGMASECHGESHPAEDMVGVSTPGKILHLVIRLMGKGKRIGNGGDHGKVFPEGDGEAHRNESVVEPAEPLGDP